MVLNLDIVTTGQKSEGSLLGSQIEAGLEETTRKRYEKVLNYVFGEKILVITGQEFKPYDTSVGVINEGGQVYRDTGVTLWTCSINLPVGSILTNVYVLGYVDEDCTIPIQWALYRRHTGGEQQEMASGAGEEVKKISFATIDTEAYTYWIDTLQAGKTMLYAILKYKL